MSGRLLQRMQGVVSGRLLQGADGVPAAAPGCCTRLLLRAGCCTQGAARRLPRQHGVVVFWVHWFLGRAPPSLLVTLVVLLFAVPLYLYFRFALLPAKTRCGC